MFSFRAIRNTRSILSSCSLRRHFATKEVRDIDKIRNIGISAHIDSGKTTLTERVLFYTGRIRSIHDVRGKDGVGAKMDSMELERERGITIQSAATYTIWNDTNINIIDTPGHVDFTIEVERALRVLDGAVLVLCASSGVQSQTMTVDNQMRRYNVPRLMFVNKLDRLGADPWKGIDQFRDQLGHTIAAVQIPIGIENDFRGIVDLISRRAIYFDGDFGETLRYDDIPSHLEDFAEEKRMELIETVADVDDFIAELFLEDKEPTEEELTAAVRRATIALKFIPVFMGSAFKNKGVQTLLDGAIEYLPSPGEVQNFAFDQDNNEEQVELVSSDSKPFVGLAFKLEQGRFGQLTYVRVYQGTVKKGDFIINASTGKKIKLPRLVRMHSDELVDVDEARAGDIVATFGVDCTSGTTFISAKSGLNYTMSSMFVPDPVMSLAIKPKDVSDRSANFSKALNKFNKEDPTFQIGYNESSQETLISGMGELHLQVYIERLKREFDVDTIVGNPEVNYKETITKKTQFSYLHKKQSGGSGQYGKVMGYIEPIPQEEWVPGTHNIEFVNALKGNDIPPDFVPAIRKGFEEAVEAGKLTAHLVEGVRFVIEDGDSHPVDSNETAFKTAAKNAFYQAFDNAAAKVLEPLMSVEVTVPTQFQGTVVGGLNQRRGDVESVDTQNNVNIIKCEVPLEEMFGYSTDIRSNTEGKGTFSMEYKKHHPVNRGKQKELIKKYEYLRVEKRVQ